MSRERERVRKREREREKGAGNEKNPILQVKEKDVEILLLKQNPN